MVLLILKSSSKAWSNWVSYSLEILRSCCCSKVFFHEMSSSIRGHHPSNVVFHQRWFSNKNRLPLKVIFKGRLPSKLFFHQMPSSIKGCHPSIFIFRPQNIFPHQEGPDIETLKGKVYRVKNDEDVHIS